MIFMTACSYTNHFLDEEGLDPSAPYRTMADLDATAYDSWTYINLETGEIESIRIQVRGTIPVRNRPKKNRLLKKSV